jgi:hypothetical protein
VLLVCSGSNLHNIRDKSYIFLIYLACSTGFMPASFRRASEFDYGTGSCILSGT